MNLVKWNSIYDNNKRLDDIFKEKYKSDNKLYEKNGIELLVEIGEFINETKVFKYWSVKNPNKDKMLEEYADVITMILTFYHEYYIDLKDYLIEITEKDLLVLFQEIYRLAINFLEKDSEIDLENLFIHVLYLGTLLEFQEDEVLNAIMKKHEIIENRLNSDY